MAKRIVWEAPDSFLRITIPVEPPLPGEIEAVYMARIAARAAQADPSLAVCVRKPDVDDFTLPTRRFRNQWRYSGGTVFIPLPAARQQLIAEIRAERVARLLESDAERARLEDVGTAAEKLALRNYRQVLRDMPGIVQSELASLATAAQLEAYEPTWPVKPF